MKLNLEEQQVLQAKLELVSINQHIHKGQLTVPHELIKHGLTIQDLVNAVEYQLLTNVESIHSIIDLSCCYVLEDFFEQLKSYATDSELFKPELIKVSKLSHIFQAFLS
jgi:hypothetical protein